MNCRTELKRLWHFQHFHLWLFLAAAIYQPRAIHAQAPPEIFEAMKSFSQRAEKFIPGFMAELPPEERAKLAQIDVDLRDEQRLGAQVLDNYETQLRKYKKSIQWRGRDVDYLKQLVAVIQPLMKHVTRYPQIRVGMVVTDQPDAYSVPGGTLLFTTGLLDTVGSEAALIGVTAHELSHLDRGHQLLPLKQSKLTAQVTDWRQLMRTMSVMKPFHPEFEREADNDAFQWMVEAGYDPRELAHLLESWDQHQNVQAPWIDIIPSFVRSHPDAGRRAESLLRQLDALGGGDDLYVGVENWERRIPRDKKRF